MKVGGLQSNPNVDGLLSQSCGNAEINYPKFRIDRPVFAFETVNFLISEPITFENRPYSVLTTVQFKFMNSLFQAIFRSSSRGAVTKR